MPSPRRLALALLLALLLPAAAGCKRGAAVERARIDALETRVLAIQHLVPDQATVMTFQAYHFTNLWFAIDRENWPLAAFYLNETSKNLAWAVRIRPTRPDQNGAEVNLAAIAESVENGPFHDMREAIGAKAKPRAVQAYKATLAGCYGCHEASGKPFLRPRIPAGPQVQILAFEPGAALPE